MIKFINRETPFNFGFKNQCIVAILLGGILALVLIFLEPFDTNAFEAENKHLIFTGFGIVFSTFYLVNSRMEITWIIFGLIAKSHFLKVTWGEKILFCVQFN